MTDLFNKTNPFTNRVMPTVRDRFFSTASQDTLPPYEALDFENSPRKVDVLLNADPITGQIDSDLFERLAIHPRLGTLIVHGASEPERLALMARAILLRVNIRFCDNDSELKVLMNKRRSRQILDSH